MVKDNLGIQHNLIKASGHRLGMVLQSSLIQIKCGFYRTLILSVHLSMRIILLIFSYIDCSIVLYNCFDYLLIFFIVICRFRTHLIVCNADYLEEHYIRSCVGICSEYWRVCVCMIVFNISYILQLNIKSKHNLDPSIWYECQCHRRNDTEMNKNCNQIRRLVMIILMMPTLDMTVTRASTRDTTTTTYFENHFIIILIL